MTAPDRRELEANELAWWSGWATLNRLGRGAYLLTSKRFQEPFFNRACFVACGAVSKHRDAAERRLRRSDRPLVMAVGKGCSSALRTLTRAGYHTSETMTVMVSKGRSQPTDRADARIREASSARDWSRAYLLSFYGETSLMPAVTGVVRRLMAKRSTTLLEARQRGEVAGALAIFRTPRLAGIYCVGTVPRYRKRGIAGALLERASEIASSEKRLMVLQTLKSDGVESFYTKRGFTALYRKCFMEKED